MRYLLLGLAFFAVAAGIGQLDRRTTSQPLNPVTVTLLSPTPGSTVSNTIPVIAQASSTAGAITKVELYVDGNLVGVLTNSPAPPKQFQVY